MTNRIDLESPTANMFGIEPCPNCHSEYRVPMKQPDGSLVIHCDDCGQVEDVATSKEATDDRAG